MGVCRCATRSIVWACTAAGGSTTPTACCCERPPASRPTRSSVRYTLPTIHYQRGVDIQAHEANRQSCVEHVDCGTTRLLLVMLPTLTNNLRFPLLLSVSRHRDGQGPERRVADPLRRPGLYQRAPHQGEGLQPSSTHLQSRKVISSFGSLKQP